ncbi:hypothetical protein D9M69_693650 [compost metagenome]
MMVQANQVMALRRFAERTLQQGQLLRTKIARYRTGNRRVEQDDAPITQVDHRLQQIAADAGGLHGRDVVMVAGKPAGRRRQRRGHLSKALVGRQATVLRQIAAGEHQVDLRLLLQHPLDHLLQTVLGIQAQ